MNALLLFVIMLGLIAQNVTKKAYNQKTSNQGTFVFSALSTLAAALFFLLSSGGKLNFVSGLYPWSLAFAVSYGFAVVFSFLAISCGSLALSSLVLSYSLVLPTLFGILFLNEPVSPWLFIGLAFLCISLLLINFKPGKIKITLRWGIYVILSFVGNGCCSIVQKLQQTTFQGAYKNEFMLLALVTVCISMIILALVSERKTTPFCLKKGCGFGLLCGAANGLVNLLVMVLTNRMPASVMFPMISAGGILGTAAVSLLFYKESLSRNQIIGVILGVGAIVFLSI